VNKLMETTSDKINVLEKNRQLESYLETLINSEVDRHRLDALKSISTIELGKYNIFSKLRTVLDDPNPEVRMLAIKVLHLKYPKKSEAILKRAIKNEDYFNIPIVSSEKNERYNINDLISYSIEKMNYGKRMVNDLFNTNLFNFLIDWKRYREFFRICYDISLQCFLLLSLEHQRVNYLCSTQKDLFIHLKDEKKISLKEISQTHPFICSIFFETFNSSRDKLRAFKLHQTENKDYPVVKIIDNISNVYCYIE